MKKQIPLNRKLITLPSYEMAKVLDKVVMRCKMDCWCYIDFNTLQIHDNEENMKVLYVVEAIRDIISGLDCRENWENLNLSSEEEALLLELVARYGINFSVPA